MARGERGRRTAWSRPCKPATLLRLPQTSARTHRGASRSTARLSAERVRARCEQQIAEWLADEPNIATRELLWSLQRAEHTRPISESTVAALRRVMEARLAINSLRVAAEAAQ